MKILIDTHIFMGWDSDATRLSREAFALGSDPGNTLLLSVISVWEMAIKAALGKLPLRAPLDNIVAEQQTRNGLEILPVSLAHVLAVQNLPLHHGYPFGRLLIAQAQTEEVDLLSADAVFALYPVKLAS